MDSGGGGRPGVLVEAGLLALIGGGMLFDARSYPASLADGAPGPAFFPSALAAALIACAIAIAVRTHRAKSPRTGRAFEPDPELDPGSDPDGDTPASRSPWRVALAAAWIAVFLLGWPRIGTVLALAPLVAGLMWLTGERSRRALVAVPIAFAAGIYLVFGVALGVPLPGGAF